jgi:hypothetical protein
MKSIFKRLCKYLAKVKRRNPDSARGADAALPPTPEQMPDIRGASQDPYAEMRSVLATTMLLG